MENEMKSIIAGLTLTTAAVGVLWLTIGGVAVGIIFAASLALVIAVVSFVFGSRWMKSAMEAGAQIALAAQVSDDKRDVIQIKALTDLTQAALKIGQQQATQHQTDYPALMSPADVIDGRFVIAGLDDDQPAQ
jgi:hypothetical protein